MLCKGRSVFIPGNMRSSRAMLSNLSPTSASCMLSPFWEPAGVCSTELGAIMPRLFGRNDRKCNPLYHGTIRCFLNYTTKLQSGPLGGLSFENFGLGMASVILSRLSRLLTESDKDCTLRSECAAHLETLINSLPSSAL